MSEELTILPEAERLIAAFQRPEDAVSLKALADAAHAYAKSARLGTASLNYCTSVKARSLKRMAELVDAGQAAGEIVKRTDTLKRGPVISQSNNGAVDLAVIGTTAVELHRARILADMSDADIMAAVDRATKLNHEITCKQLIKEARAARREVNDETPDAEPGPEVAPGDWWRLGRHLLYCGDTSESVFADSCPSAAFAFADPPYGLGVAAWDSEFVWDHDWLAERAPIVAVTPGINSIFTFARRTAMPYRWSVACWTENGMTYGELGFGNWIYTALFSDVSLRRESQDFLRVTIDVSESGETKHHGRKPAGLIRWLLNAFTTEGDTVIDPFAGSGTTLLVAEKMGRTCYTGDIDAEFCSEIIGRWQALTGEEADRA